MRFARKLPRTSVRISPSANLRIGHLLIVAGASGAGKSTFLRQLHSGGVDPEILARMPPGASWWPQTNGRRIRGRLEEVRDEHGTLLIHGLVLHYDIMRVFETRISGYAEDPELAALAKADEITAVVVRPSDRHLAEQAVNKSKRRCIARLLGDLERRFRMARHPMQMSVYLTHDHRERHARLARNYLMTGFADRWYDCWRSFLVSTAGNRLTSSVVTIEPFLLRGQPSFRLRPGIAENA